MALYRVCSPAQPSPRLASVTPTWVTLSSRSGFASSSSAARAETIALSGQLLEPGAPDGHQRHFGGGEKSVQGDDAQQ